MSNPFYGKYRGTVINNIDPLLIGRIQAIVPDVAGLIPSSWAMPCVPVAGINMGVFTVPPIGGTVNTPIFGPATGTQGMAQLDGISPDTSGTIAWMRPICSGSMLLTTVPRYLP